MKFAKKDQELLAEAYENMLEEGFRNKLLGGLALAGLAAGGYSAMKNNDNVPAKQAGVEQSANKEYKIGDSVVTVLKSGGTTIIEVKTQIRKSLGQARGLLRAEEKNNQHAEKMAEHLGFSSINLTPDTDNAENTGDYVLRYYKINPDAKKLTMGGDYNTGSNTSNKRTTFVDPGAFDD